MYCMKKSKVEPTKWARRFPCRSHSSGKTPSRKFPPTISSSAYSWWMNDQCIDHCSMGHLERQSDGWIIHPPIQDIWSCVVPFCQDQVKTWVPRYASPNQSTLKVHFHVEQTFQSHSCWKRRKKTELNVALWLLLLLLLLFMLWMGRIISWSLSSQEMWFELVVGFY